MSTLLAVEGMTKRFGGLVAVDDATLDVAEGSITGLIGPNGAGKTTLFTLIAGFETPTSGRVIFAGQDITRLRTHQRAEAGIARTFQIVQPFAGLSVHENIAVGAFLRHHARQDALDHAARVAERVGLVGMLDQPASELTVAGRKRLELARALATDPRLLLLDEVLAGLNPSEIRDMIPVVQAIRADGVSILIVEHVMQAVMSLCDRVHVLAQGRIIAQGTPGEVARDSRVIEAYLGAGAAARMQAQGAEVRMLEVRDLVAGYGGVPILRNVSLDVGEGEIVAVLGANGVGKTTLNRAISGLIPISGGSIRFDGVAISGQAPQAIVTQGLIQVPEGRKIFPNLTVRDNLELGSYARAKANRARNIARIFTIFPRLAERQGQYAGTLSGGEQQMLAIGRGLMAEPRLLILDEPSLGLSPLLVEEMFALIQRIAAEGLAVMLVEQNVVQSLDIAARAYVLENGAVAMAGAAADLRRDARLMHVYLGM